MKIRLKLVANVVKKSKSKTTPCIWTNPLSLNCYKRDIYLQEVGKAWLWEVGHLGNVTLAWSLCSSEHRWRICCHEELETWLVTFPVSLLWISLTYTLLDLLQTMPFYKKKKHLRKINRIIFEIWGLHGRESWDYGLLGSDKRNV